MKNFICTIPYQDPKKTLYSNPCNNNVLEYSEPARFPIHILIHNTVKSGEKIRITMIYPDYENCHNNYKLFIEELDKIKNDIGFEYEIDKISTPYSENIEDHLDLFGKLLDSIHDDDEIYADISYGSKPVPIIIFMVLTYAYKFRDGFIENIIYSLVNFNKQNEFYLGALYDVTALFYMNSTINTMDETSNPEKFIKAMLEL